MNAKIKQAISFAGHRKCKSPWITPVLKINALYAAEIANLLEAQSRDVALGRAARKDRKE